jgi:hypothetical protein
MAPSIPRQTDKGLFKYLRETFGGDATFVIRAPCSRFIIRAIRRISADFTRNLHLVRNAEKPECIKTT